MGLALDEPNESDHKYVEEDITFVISPDIHSWLPRGTPIRINYNRYWGGFTVSLDGYGTC